MRLQDAVADDALTEERARICIRLRIGFHTLDPEPLTTRLFKEEAEAAADVEDGRTRSDEALQRSQDLGRLSPASRADRADVRVLVDQRELENPRARAFDDTEEQSAGAASAGGEVGQDPSVDEHGSLARGAFRSRHVCDHTDLEPEEGSRVYAGARPLEPEYRPTAHR